MKKDKMSLIMSLSREIVNANNEMLAANINSVSSMIDKMNLKTFDRMSIMGKRVSIKICYISPATFDPRVLLNFQKFIQHTPDHEFYIEIKERKSRFSSKYEFTPSLLQRLNKCGAGCYTLANDSVEGDVRTLRLICGKTTYYKIVNCLYEMVYESSANMYRIAQCKDKINSLLE